MRIRWRVQNFMPNKLTVPEFLVYKRGSQSCEYGKAQFRVILVGRDPRDGHLYYMMFRRNGSTEVSCERCYSYKKHAYVETQPSYNWEVIQSFKFHNDDDVRVLFKRLRRRGWKIMPPRIYIYVSLVTSVKDFMEKKFPIQWMHMEMMRAGIKKT